MGLRDFLKKNLDFFDAEEERNLPGNAGKSDAQFRTGCVRNQIAIRTF